MKIALLSDTHWGARGDSQLFLDYFTEFFQDTFFPYLDENNIKTVLHAGDLMDRRKFVNFNVLNHVREHFIQPLKDRDVELHCILGNHDVYYRNTNKINSMRELFYSDFHIYENPTTLEFDGLRIAMLPWVNKENTEEFMKYIQNVNAPILMGHLELDGYEVLRGVKHRGGMSPDMFKRFEKVLSGHFHCKQSQGNIHYLGTQYEITFSDHGEPKGFHVLDTETREIEYVENPNRMFHKLKYSDDDTYTEAFCNQYTNKYVKVFVSSKKNPVKFDKFLESLYNSQVANLTIVEEDDLDQEKVDIDMKKDTLTLIQDEVDMLECEGDKEKIKKMIRDLYMESLTL
jgi:DNA repair exonuclease SbcCD nuclease subunit